MGVITKKTIMGMALVASLTLVLAIAITYLPLSNTSTQAFPFAPLWTQRSSAISNEGFIKNNILYDLILFSSRPSQLQTIGLYDSVYQINAINIQNDTSEWGSGYLVLNGSARSGITAGVPHIYLEGNSIFVVGLTTNLLFEGQNLTAGSPPIPVFFIIQLNSNTGALIQIQSYPLPPNYYPDSFNYVQLNGTIYSVYATYSSTQASVLVASSETLAQQKANWSTNYTIPISPGWGLGSDSLYVDSNYFVIALGFGNGSVYVIDQSSGILLRELVPQGPGTPFTTIELFSSTTVANGSFFYVTRSINGFGIDRVPLKGGNITGFSVFQGSPNNPPAYDFTSINDNLLVYYDQIISLCSETGSVLWSLNLSSVLVNRLGSSSTFDNPISFSNGAMLASVGTMSNTGTSFIGFVLVNETNGAAILALSYYFSSSQQPNYQSIASGDNYFVYYWNGYLVCSMIPK